MSIKYSNNALTLLQAGIGVSDTTLTVVPGDGNNFPVVDGASGDYFVVTLEDASGNLEFIRVNHRPISTDTFGNGTYPCERGYWGSTARSWQAGDSVDLRWTAEGADAIRDEALATTVAALAAFEAAMDVDIVAAVNAHNALETGVHGVTGTVVGTSDSQTLTNKTFGDGTTFGGAVKVKTGTSGATANAASDELVVEHSVANGGITILGIATAVSRLTFGDPDDNDIGSVQYNHSTDTLNFYANTFRMLTLDGANELVKIERDIEVGDALRMSVANNVATEADFMFYGAGVLAAEASLYLNVDATNSGSGSLRFGSGAPTSAATEHARMNPTGELLFNHTAPVDSEAGTADVQVHGAQADAALGAWRWDAGSPVYGGSIFLGRAHANTIGTFTAVGDGDVLGNVAFQGADGTAMQVGAMVVATARGTWGASDTPAELNFFVTPSGSAAPSERLRLDSAGQLRLGPTAVAGSWGYVFEVAQATDTLAVFRNSSISGATAKVRLSGRRTANGNYPAELEFGNREDQETDQGLASIAAERNGTNLMDFVFKNGGAGGLTPTENLRIPADGDVMYGPAVGVRQVGHAEDATDVANTVEGDLVSLTLADVRAGSKITVIARAEVTFTGAAAGYLKLTDASNVQLDVETVEIHGNSAYCNRQSATITAQFVAPANGNRTVKLRGWGLTTGCTFTSYSIMAIEHK